MEEVQDPIADPVPGGGAADGAPADEDGGPLSPHLGSDVEDAFDSVATNIRRRIARVAQLAVVNTLLSGFDGERLPAAEGTQRRCAAEGA